MRAHTTDPTLTIPCASNAILGSVIPFDDVKGTNGRQKTYEISHVYSIFYSGFMCQTTVNFGIMKDGSLVLNTLAL